MEEPTDPLILILADMPDVVEGLLRDHVPDALGRCRACGTPGTGSAQVIAPCPLRCLAESARALRGQASGR